MSATFKINLPDDVVANFRAAAGAAHRSIEDLMIETLTAHQPAPPAVETGMMGYTDEQLWRVVHQHLMPEQKKRLDELNAKNLSSKTLSPTEEPELRALTEAISRLMTRRTEALLLLQQRGHDIQSYMNTVQPED